LFLPADGRPDVVEGFAVDEAGDVALLDPSRIAQSVGANAFAFVLAVTFAASTTFMTPVGYQTNLMVYTPGGYGFLDFVRVGAPLQLLWAVVTTLGIAGFWGV
jgi:di/tricarboxylate transporter